MKVKTSELQGAALDWAVAQCEYFPVRYGFDDNCPEYSTDWSQGGPIIEKNRLKVVYFAPPQVWHVSRLRYGGLCEPHDMEDPSLLVAAMRCYVSSKLGEEIEIPEELK